MRNKIVHVGNEGQGKLIDGINTLYNAVSSTLGPAGKSVVIEKDNAFPDVTKDGVSVANSIRLSDPAENLGVDLIKQAAINTAEKAGDGTTTSTVLVHNIISEGMKVIDRGINPNAIKTGIELARDKYTKILSEKYTTPIEDIADITNVATISCNNDKKLGEVIANAIEEVGVDGAININASANHETYYDMISGLKIDRRGWLSPYLVTNQSKNTVELENPLYYISATPISSAEDTIKLLGIAKRAERSIVFIAPDINGQALTTIVTNSSRGIVKASAVKAPMFGDLQGKLLEDIACLVNTTVNNVATKKAFPIDEISVDFLGSSDKFIQTYEDSTIISGHGDEDVIMERIESIKEEHSNGGSTDLLDFLQERMSKLASGVVLLYVGAASESELKEKKDRVEDALHATRAAIEEGIIIGGGVTNLKMRDEILSWLDETKDTLSDDVIKGIEIFAKALSAPIKKILGNAMNSEEDINKIVFKILNNLKDKNYGYNVYSKEFVDMKEAGVIDPARVARVSVESAVSIAALVLTTECVISNDVN
jgi:chaperonin GroEL